MSYLWILDTIKVKKCIDPSHDVRQERKRKKNDFFFPSTLALVSRCLNWPRSELVNLYTVNIELGDTSKLTGALFADKFLTSFQSFISS